MKPILSFINEQIIDYTKPMYDKNRYRLLTNANNAIDKYTKFFNTFVELIPTYSGMNVINKDINNDYIEISIDNSEDKIKLNFKNNHDIQLICHKIIISEYNEFLNNITLDLYSFDENSIQMILSSIYYNYKLYKILKANYSEILIDENTNTDDAAIYYIKKYKLNVMITGNGTCLTLFKDIDLTNKVGNLNTTGNINIDMNYIFKEDNTDKFNESFVKMRVEKYMLIIKEITKRPIKHFFSKENK